MDGPAILTSRGISDNLARFARTHAQWSLEDEPSNEDLIVALANTIWTGARNERLEALIIDRLAWLGDAPKWSVFARFDDVLLPILEGAGERLALYRAILEDDEP